MRRPTLRDVARLAGVSPATVSKAINDREHVSATTRQRVLQAARTVGFVPRRGRRDQPPTLGLLVVGLGCRRVGPLVHAVADPVERVGGDLVVVVRSLGVSVAEGVGELLRLRPDAVLVVGRARGAAARLHGVGVPLAVVDSPGPAPDDQRLRARARAAGADLIAVATAPKQDRKGLRSEMSGL